MEAILDALRRIIGRWVETITPITANVSVGDTILYVDSSVRFKEGDEVMIEGPLEGEPNLIIEEIIDYQTIKLATPVANQWLVSENMCLRKLLNGMYIEGIYIGNPEVIPQYPAITINGTSIDSEWMTLDSTKERFEVELTVYVEEATQEDGYRFLLKLTETIIKGLKSKVTPLINDYDMTAITQDIEVGDEVIEVADAHVFNTPFTTNTSDYPQESDARVIIEDKWKSEETRVQDILSPTHVSVMPILCNSFKVANNPVAIRPKRFIYNSWPHHTDLGKAQKNTLLQTSVIRWFAEEEQIQEDFRSDPTLR